jgi:hypothetical protein
MRSMKHVKGCCLVTAHNPPGKVSMKKEALRESELEVDSTELE